MERGKSPRGLVRVGPGHDPGSNDPGEYFGQSTVWVKDAAVVIRRVIAIAARQRRVVWRALPGAGLRRNVFTPEITPHLLGLRKQFTRCGTTLILRQCDIESSWMRHVAPDAVPLHPAAVPCDHGKMQQAGVGQEQTFPMSTQFRLGITLLLVAAVVATAGIWLAREVSIDKCLDRGGAWDHEEARCLFAVAR